jgi:hypothetical protein
MSHPSFSRAGNSARLSVTFTVDTALPRGAPDRQPQTNKETNDEKLENK